MTSPLLILEGPRHCHHTLVREGLVVFMPCPRIAPWPDNRPEVPAPWGNEQARLELVVAATARVWSELPQEQRYLQIVGGLARCCDRTFPGGGPRPTLSDILRGLFTGTFACWQDIALLGTFAKRLEILGMRPFGVWFDAESWPHDDAPEYADVLDPWHRATGRPTDQLAQVARDCLNASARTVLAALGWADARAITVEARNSVASHNWGPEAVDSDDTAATYCTIPATETPADFARYLDIAKQKCCAGVFIYAQDATAEQLESHRAAIAAWSTQ